MFLWCECIDDLDEPRLSRQNTYAVPLVFPPWSTKIVDPIRPGAWWWDVHKSSMRRVGKFATCYWIYMPTNLLKWKIWYYYLYSAYVISSFIKVLLTIKGALDKYNMYLFISNSVEDVKLNQYQNFQLISAFYDTFCEQHHLQCPICYCIVYLLKSTLKNKKC